MASYHGPASKPRATKVKPILRKLAQGEKNSLDLDRPAAEQDGLGIYDYGTGPRLSHELTFSQAGRRTYHNRSTSGTSQFSTATSTSGGHHRSGSFVHPFQQTPRPFTPPQGASYQNSLRESEPSDSPSPTEDEDLPQRPSRSTSNATNLTNRTPLLTGGASLSPFPNPHPIGSAKPQPILHLQTQQPSSSRTPLSTSHTSLTNNLSSLSPVDLPSSIEPMSPSTALRTSFDKGFRLRSRSEIETTRDRALSIQEARRKFQEKEQAKDEKAAREEVRQLEKRNQKEALKIERSHRRSSASDGTRSKRSKSELNEKQGGAGEGLFVHGYGVASDQGLSHGAEEGPQRSRRHSATNNAKKKTLSAWTKLMMWIRTRIIRMKGKSKSKGKKRPPPPTPYYSYGTARN